MALFGFIGAHGIERNIVILERGRGQGLDMRGLCPVSLHCRKRFKGAKNGFRGGVAKKIICRFS